MPMCIRREETLGKHRNRYLETWETWTHDKNGKLLNWWIDPFGAMFSWLFQSYSMQPKSFLTINDARLDAALFPTLALRRTLICLGLI
jgi:hypothetical protein